MGDSRDRLKQHLINTSATEYQRDALKRIQYTGPAKCAEIADKYCQNNREDLRVFEVNVGIGLAGIEMMKKGFTHIDGVDQSTWMLEKAKDTNSYTNLYYKEFTSARTCIPSGSYDLVISCGACDRLPYDAIDNMIRITKSGGLVCIVNRRATFDDREDYKEHFFPLCDRLEQEGKWTKLEISTYEGFLGNENGIIIVYRVN